jgi:hypothetical protein
VTTQEREAKWTAFLATTREKITQAAERQAALAAQTWRTPTQPWRTAA